MASNEIEILDPEASVGKLNENRSRSRTESQALHRCPRYDWRCGWRRNDVGLLHQQFRRCHDCIDSAD